MTQPSVDRLSINAAIECLISEEEEGWLEAAQAVTQFGLSIPPGNGFRTKIAESSSGGNNEITGHSPGIGDVSIPDKETERSEAHTGQVIERVGYYKIIHRQSTKKNSGVVEFWHYRQNLVWQKPEECEPPSQYALFYNEGSVHTFAIPILERKSLRFWDYLTIYMEVGIINLLFSFINPFVKQSLCGVRWTCKSHEIILSTRYTRGMTKKNKLLMS